MNTKHRFVTELERFLTDHVGEVDAVWPRLRRIEAADPGASKVLVAGNIVLDIPVSIDAPFGEFMAACAEGREKFRAEWALGTPTVGGFVGHVAPLALQAGFEVHIGSTIAVPSPRPICEFLEGGSYDTQRVRALAGATPAAFELRFNDGRHLLLPRCGVDQGGFPTIGNVDGFAAALLNGGPQRGRIARLVTLFKSFGDQKPVLGIVARGDWGPAEFRLLRETRCWVFFSRHEALVASGLSDLEEAARRIKSQLGHGPRLVVTLDREGAWLLNGHPHIVRFRTTPVCAGHAKGAGDTLAVIATLASSSGKCDEEAAQLAVEAATRRVAGDQLASIAV